LSASVSIAIIPYNGAIREEIGVPSLFRLIFIIGATAGLVYVGMLALANFVTPHPHQIIETVPTSRLNK
jgi:hypothetical protein